MPSNRKGYMRQYSLDQRAHPGEHFCDCGNRAAYWFAGWECQRCHDIRKRMEYEQLKYAISPRMQRAHA